MSKVLATATAVLVFGVSGTIATPTNAEMRGGSFGHNGGFVAGRARALPPAPSGPAFEHGVFAKARPDNRKPDGFNDSGFHKGEFRNGRFNNNRFGNNRFNNNRFGNNGAFYGGFGYGFYDGYGSGDTTQAVYVGSQGVREDAAVYRPPEPITPACFTIAKVWNPQLRRNLDQTVRHAC